jgi:hypothetical protein
MHSLVRFAAKLRAKGLVEKVPGSRFYQLVGNITTGVGTLAALERIGRPGVRRQLLFPAVLPQLTMLPNC